MEDLIKSIEEYVFLQYMYIVKSNDYGEAGLPRIKSDFYRYYKKIPADQNLSLSELDKFEKEIDPSLWGMSLTTLKVKINSFSFVYEKVKFRTNETDLLNKILGKDGFSERLFIGAKKEGFPILLFGPCREEKNAFIMEKELVRSPAAVLSMVALTNSSSQLIIRMEALDYVFWKKWVQGTGDKRVYSAYGVKSGSDLIEIKELFLSEMLETTILHELGHVAIADNFEDKEKNILSKLLSATTPNCPLEALDELMVEWFPQKGVIPCIANLSKRDPIKASRLFLRYLAEGDKLLASTMIRYVKDGQIDFVAVAADCDNVFNILFAEYNKYLDMIISHIKSAEFSYKGMTVLFDDLAKMQHKKFREQDKDIDSESKLYKRYFWANMLNYVKSCSQQTREKISDLLRDGHLNLTSIGVPLN